MVGPSGVRRLHSRTWAKPAPEVPGTEAAPLLAYGRQWAWPKLAVLLIALPQLWGAPQLAEAGNAAPKHWPTCSWWQ